jgi:uncharacterized protein
MRVILDTNSFISRIGKKFPYRKAFDAFLQKKYNLCISTEILLEHEEVFGEKRGEEVTTNLLSRIMIADNIVFQTNYFQFNLVVLNPEDNKFVDTCIASNADYLVSNDKHILSLRKSDFTPINVITLQEFTQLLS